MIKRRQLNDQRDINLRRALTQALLPEIDVVDGNVFGILRLLIRDVLREEVKVLCDGSLFEELVRREET